MLSDPVSEPVAWAPETPVSIGVAGVTIAPAAVDVGLEDVIVTFEAAIDVAAAAGRPDEVYDARIAEEADSASATGQTVYILSASD